MPRRPGKQHELRACFQCAKGKLKCVPDALDPDKCQRCVRLQKPCTPQPQAGSLSPAEIHSSSGEASASATENRASFPQQAPPRPAARGSSDEPGAHSRLFSPAAEMTLPNFLPAHFLPIARPAGDSVPPSRSYIGSQVPLSSILDAEIKFPGDRAADALVETYRQQHSECFPFIVVPPGFSSTLRTRRPFLLKAISMVASYRDKGYQHRLGSEILEEISRRIVIGGERSLDLLQGLLLYIAWYHNHLATRSRITILIQLANGLLFDLGLHRSASANERGKLVFDSANPSYGFTFHNETRTLEQRRVLLGCFYLSVVISAAFKNIDCMEYTDYIDKSCDALLAARDHPLDVHAVWNVRLQSIVAKVSHNTLSDSLPGGSIRAPLAMHVQAIEQELHTFHAGFPADLQKNHGLRLRKHAAYMYVNEVALFTNAWQQRQGAALSKRLDMLFSCLESTKVFVEQFLDIPVQHLQKYSFPVWVDVVVAILICARLTLVDCTGWDHAYVQETLNFSTVVEKLQRRFQEAIELAERDHYSFGDSHIMSRLSVHLRRVKEWYEAELGASGSGEIQEQRREQLRIGMDGKQGSFSGQAVDEGFWQEMMSIWELLQS